MGQQFLATATVCSAAAAKPLIAEANIFVAPNKISFVFPKVVATTKPFF